MLFPISSIVIASIYGYYGQFKVTEDIELNEAYLVYDEERTYRYYDKLYELINYFNSRKRNKYYCLRKPNYLTFIK